jgi:metallo-beta-lactamase class B
VRRLAATLIIAIGHAHRIAAQTPPDSVERARECASCAEWNVPQKPLRIFANAYYVGTHGLSVILITSAKGHVLIDGALPESVPQVLANIRALGFRPEDVKFILNSHAHFDHAGGIGLLSAATGAMVMASPWSADVIETGQPVRDDPQFGLILGYPRAEHVRPLHDGQVVALGGIELTAHFTGGHTPGGTSWTWQSCEASRCLHFVYADSQTPVSNDDFQFTNSAAAAAFKHSFDVLEHLQCDILVTPHPAASNFFERVAARDAGDASSLTDREACRRLAAGARGQLAARIAKEKSGR